MDNGVNICIKDEDFSVYVVLLTVTGKEQFTYMECLYVQDSIHQTPDRGHSMLCFATQLSFKDKTYILTDEDVWVCRQLSIGRLGQYKRTDVKIGMYHFVYAMHVYGSKLSALHFEYSSPFCFSWQVFKGMLHTCFLFVPEGGPRQ